MKLRDLFPGKKDETISVIKHINIPGQPSIFTRRSGERYMTENELKGFMERRKRDMKAGQAETDKPSFNKRREGTAKIIRSKNFRLIQE